MKPDLPVNARFGDSPVAGGSLAVPYHAHLAPGHPGTGSDRIACDRTRPRNRSDGSNGCAVLPAIVCRKRGPARLSGGAELEAQPVIAHETIDQTATMLAFGEAALRQAQSATAQDNLAARAALCLDRHHRLCPESDFSVVVLVENLHRKPTTETLDRLVGFPVPCPAIATPPFFKSWLELQGLKAEEGLGCGVHRTPLLAFDLKGGVRRNNPWALALGRALKEHFSCHA